ncbi:hypothetical protein U1Q18_017445 [Sarracenia purpurea var. burkii]
MSECFLKIEAPLPKNIPNRENWPTSHKSRCVDGGITEEFVSEASRTEKGEGIEGNVSNKERNGRCAISEAEEGVARDSVFMEVDPFRVSKGGNPNFYSDHKSPAEPEIAENLVKPPLPTATNSTDPTRVSQANVYGDNSGKQYSFVQEAAHTQGFMEVEPAFGYPISENVSSSPISQPSLRRQKTWARKKRDVPKFCGQPATKIKRQLVGEECADSVGKAKKIKLQERIFSSVEVRKEYEGQSDIFPTAEAAQQPCRSP